MTSLKLNYLRAGLEKIPFSRHNFICAFLSTREQEEHEVCLLLVSNFWFSIVYNLFHIHAVNSRNSFNGNHYINYPHQTLTIVSHVVISKAALYFISYFPCLPFLFCVIPNSINYVYKPQDYKSHAIKEFLAWRAAGFYLFWWVRLCLLKYIKATSFCVSHPSKQSCLLSLSPSSSPQFYSVAFIY